MKYLLAITMLVLSISSFAEDLSAQLGEDKGAYQQCMKDTADCTVGCEKSCAHLDPAQYEADTASKDSKGEQKGTSANQN